MLYLNQPIFSIIAFDLNGKYIKEYSSIKEASKDLFNGCKKVHIWNDLMGLSLRCGQYHFILKENYDSTRNYSYQFRKKLKKFKKTL